MLWAASCWVVREGQEGGQLQHLMSQDAQNNPVANTLTATLPVASGTSNFAKYQHQRDCCGYCAAPCNQSELQDFECNCGAICCSDCYGLASAETRRILSLKQFTFKCDTCREQHSSDFEAVVVVSHPNRACSQNPT